MSQTGSPSEKDVSRQRTGRVWAVGIAAVLLGVLVWWVAVHRAGDKPNIPYFTIEQGKVRKPLDYRIVSFHRARFDRKLIKLAAQLGFNGVQFQIEGSNEEGIADFARRDRDEHIVDYCHSLGMKVTLWVHEFADLPPALSPDYLGEITLDNEKVWNAIDQRYEWVLGKMVPNVDGLVLTCVETQFKSTATPIMQKLVTRIDQKCREHGKQLIVRTFVWHPEELEGVMGAVKALPEDIVIMSKVVPQDWQMRGGNAMEIGRVGNHPQIVEYDVAGEYFLSDAVANCMVDKLKEQFDYGLSKGAAGICVRVDRYDASVLWEPNEVNLWALGMLAAGATNDMDDVWQRWATYRYGDKAAPGVIVALKPTSEVMGEMLSVGPFTYGDARQPYVQGRPTYQVGLPYEDLFSAQNWQMWRWDNSYAKTLDKVEKGDPVFIDQLKKQQSKARAQAEESLAKLEEVKPLLAPREYLALQGKLITSKVQLEFRASAALAALHFRQMVHAGTQPQFDNAYGAYTRDLGEIRKLKDSLGAYPPAETVDYLGKKWVIKGPALITREQLETWLTLAEGKEQLRNSLWLWRGFPGL